MSKKCRFKLALICGGPSLERGVSLNSARSVMDHLKGDEIEIIPFYVSQAKQFYRLSQAQLYSNTPADFDFKLQKTALPLDPSSLVVLLKNVDLVFSVIHGAFGEDGELQAFLEENQIPFVGQSQAYCRRFFHKGRLVTRLKEEGFPTLPQLVVSSSDFESAFSEISGFFQQHALQKAMIKPAVGGSSIGVHAVQTPIEALERLREIFKQQLASEALIEPFCRGKEFTLVIFQNFDGDPVALIPTEIELRDPDTQFFDYRKKYLPTNQVAYHTPPHFSEGIIQRIRTEGESLFRFFEMRDFIRLDGWVMEDENIYWTDFNPMSGLEQNSFFFRQAALSGMTHRQALDYVVEHACSRYGLTLHSLDQSMEKGSFQGLVKRPVYVLFGGENAERQVSLMSGTNVWLKLLHSSHYSPVPFFLDSDRLIWRISYSYLLNHTVEEIHTNCLHEREEKKREDLQKKIQSCLGIDFPLETSPQCISIEDFLQEAKKEEAFVFLALHGGDGENGTFQTLLERHHLPFNGSLAQASALCMDKFLTGKVINSLSGCMISSLPKKSLVFDNLKAASFVDLEHAWEQWCKELNSERLLLKPRYEGCSAGIVLLQSPQDLARYCELLFKKADFIPPYSFANQSSPIEMPASFTQDYLLEPYIETDAILIQGAHLQVLPSEGWIELTVGVLEEKERYHAFNPSITIAEGAVLSIEEKFQGGTGINLTPPPEEILSLEAAEKIKRGVEKAAQALGIQNYARLDLFFNRKTEKLILIEANTLPALTPSTVLYHQALAENPPLFPLELLNRIISSKWMKSCV